VKLCPTDRAVDVRNSNGGQGPLGSGLGQGSDSGENSYMTTPSEGMPWDAEKPRSHPKFAGETFYLRTAKGVKMRREATLPVVEFEVSALLLSVTGMNRAPIWIVAIHTNATLVD
jgi:hypothetical protein